MEQGPPTAAEPGSAPLSASPAFSFPPPLPTAPATDDPQASMRPPRLAGQLSPPWRLVFGFAWAAIIACNAAVWESSRVIGLSTWWLGADAQPRFLLLQLLPFYGPIVVAVGSVSNWRYVSYVGIGAAVIGAAIGAGDLGRVKWIALVELLIAGSALCVSAASLAGMYRRVPVEQPAG